VSTDQNSQPGAGGVNLTKVSLTKSAPKVSLTKAGESQGIMRVNLNWTSRVKKTGFFRSSKPSDVDLDLGCLYELADGKKSVIQALGKRFGSRRESPFIELDGDDRSGDSDGGENLFINLERPDRFKRILIFAMIYEGAANFAAVDGVVTMFPTSGPQVEVRLDSPDGDSRTCAIALLTYTSSGLTVQREDRYINGAQRQLDEAYNWGMNWKAGQK
jgi:tellurite resistance protein TerA